MQKLAGQSVTGGAGGLGRAIAARCLAEGATVLACDCDTSGLAQLTDGLNSPHLHATGAIVNISSVADQEGSSDAVYGLSKAALIGLTKSLAMNFAPHIRVNAVAPGLASTPMLDRVPTSRLRQYRTAELLSEPITPAAVAASVAFLLSDESRHCTGMVLDLNNGCYRR